MKDLVLCMVKALVDHQDAVRVDEIQGERTAVLELKVHPEDRGKIIGKEGRIIKCIRTIVSASGTRTNKRCSVELVE